MLQPAIIRALCPCARLALAGLLTVASWNACGQTGRGSSPGTAEITEFTAKAAEAEACVKTVKLAESAAGMDISDMQAVIRKSGADLSRAKDAVEKALEATKEVRPARNKAQEAAGRLQNLAPVVQALSDEEGRVMSAAAQFKDILDATRQAAAAAGKVALDTSGAGEEAAALTAKNIDSSLQQAAQGKAAALQLAKQIKLLAGEVMQTAQEISAATAQITQAALLAEQAVSGVRAAPETNYP